MNDAQSQSVWRFAPSPNGLLHLGHAYSALRNFIGARESGGRFLLRIEDIDAERSRPQFEAAIYEDLAWLGLEWETPVRRQSEHIGEYALALDRLRERSLVYPCFCSRREIAQAVEGRPDWPRDPDGAPLYPGTCKHMTRQTREAFLLAGRHAAMRLDMAQAAAQLEQTLGWREFGEGEVGRDVRAEPQTWGDVVVARRDVSTSYHLAVVIDDAVQGVTDVSRGMDLFHATSVHRLLQALLDLPAPEYRHHRLILDDDEEKLSKSRGSATLRDLRGSGARPQDIRKMVGLA
ncbi:MAG: tRNA glutamyl-Q(34) synthetase GluQRS [Rhodoblastus sp.]